MKVLGFDHLAYPEHMDHLKVDGELPYPLTKRHFNPETALGNYNDHLDAWELMEELGFDGIGFQRAPYLALRHDGLSQPDGGGGFTTNQKDEIADLWQLPADPPTIAFG